MDNRHVIMDPLYGAIEVSEVERRVINHQLFQRLRHISQLGNVALVFPSASHTRFSHSIGVMEVASRMFDSIFNGYKTQGGYSKLRQLVRLAGLLHDVGHGAYSHAIEDAFSGLKAKDIRKSAIPDQCLENVAEFDEKPLKHETFSFIYIHVILKDIEEEDVVYDPKNVCAMLDGGFKDNEEFKRL